jgi:hypothetical protein
MTAPRGQDDILSVRESPPAIRLAVAASSALSAALILALAVLSIAPALGGSLPNSFRDRQPAAKAEVRRLRVPSTVVFVVGSNDQARSLTSAFADWDLVMQEHGLELPQVTRLVVAEGPEEVLMRRFFDFSYIPESQGGAEFRFVDLRNK